MHPDFSPMAEGTDAPSSTQKSYAGEGWLGRIGFISSMSDHFCGGCNRLRLTADGHLKVCLFDNRELDLKTLIESNAALNDSIVAVFVKTLDAATECWTSRLEKSTDHFLERVALLGHPSWDPLGPS